MCGHSKKPRQVLVHHWGAMHSNASLASRRHLCLGQSWIFCGGQNNSTCCVVLNPTWGNSRVIGRRRVRKVLTCFLSGFRLVRYLTRVSGFRGACQRQIASIHLAQVQPSMASQAKEKCFCPSQTLPCLLVLAWKATFEKRLILPKIKVVLKWVHPTASLAIESMLQLFLFLTCLDILQSTIVSLVVQESWSS